EDLLQRVVAAALHVVGEAPVVAGEPRHQHGVGPEVEELARRVHREPPPFGAPSPRSAAAASSSTNASSFSPFIQLTIRWLLTSITGASPHAPMHSPSLSVKRPSGVVSPKPTPRRFLSCAAASVAPDSAHGRFVQIVSLK